MINEKYTLHSVVFSNGLSADVQINQLKDVQISPNLSRYFEYGSGQVDPTFAVVDSEEPLITFSSTAVKRVLTAVNMTTGRAITSSDTCTLYFQKMVNGGTRTGTGSLTVTVSVGIACVSKISAANGSPAMIEVMVYAASSDGETSPLAYGTGSAPALADTDQLFTIGPALLNDTAFEGVESVEIDTKINIRRNRADGSPYPTFLYIQRRGSEQDAPSIRLSTRHMGELNGSSVLDGTTTAIDGGASSFVSFRAFKSGSTRWALASTEHITVDINGGLISVESAGSRDGDEGMLDINITSTKVGSTDPFTPNLGVAIDLTP